MADSVKQGIQRSFLLMRKKLFGAEITLCPLVSFGEDYSRHWGYTEFEDKIVLDLGADFGSTTYFFLEHGAKRVIAVEGNEKLGEMLLHNFDKDSRVAPIIRWIDSPAKVTELIEKFRPDIVKCDIEGAEENLLNVPLQSVGVWLVEAHSNEIYARLVDKFHGEKFKISKFPYVNGLTVIIAEKKGVQG